LHKRFLTIKKNIFIMAFKGIRVICFIWALRVRGSCPKEGAMNRRLTWCVGIAGIILATATWVSAASMDDIAGTWGVYTKAKGRVSKLGSDHSEGFGAIKFDKGPPGPNTGSFAYKDPGYVGYTYTGNFTLSTDGKKLTMQLDDNGRQEFEDMMADWLHRGALGEGISLDRINFVYDKNGILMSTVKTSKKTNGPTKGTVSAKGIVYADVYQNGVLIGLASGKFSFKSTTKFLTKQHP
jgi:hypothetical protein